jgi:hypothetical protein
MILLGLAAPAVLFLVPTSVTVFGTMGSCGAPIVRVLSHDESSDSTGQSLLNECRSQSWPHVIAGGAVAVIFTIGGILMLALGGELRPRYGPQNPPGWWWDGHQWRPQMPPTRRQSA